ncbi:hypothetical protein [Sulfurovum sp.]|uniref:hypothetical protein n=1 Tax=Sulfurovum sp. TaxID=1969726 RepID=UPI0025F64C34|nr:hypothetical protein [Sulfurovum sp.]
MKHHCLSLIALVTTGSFLFTGISLPCMGSQTEGKNMQSRANPSLTVRPGTPVRKAILDALRQKMKRLHGVDVVFVVKYLKVKDGWSWVHTLPQSLDGKEHYEDLSALLQQKGGSWSVVELACTEEENPQCLSHPEYFSTLKKRFPKLPGEILPKKK